MNMRASVERASLNIFAFSHSKTAISFNILLVLLILYLRNIYISGLSVSNYNLHESSMQFPVLTYGMALYIQTKVYRQNTDFEKNLCICE